MSDDPSGIDSDGHAASDSTIPVEALATRGSTIGPYYLRERIGVGGMGEVWRAEQSSPLRRTVALKLIKAGMDSREVLARFEAERQALALMDHPCIAKVFDAGTTSKSRPYFAMEYVPGVSITHYCDRRRLDVVERLQLFQLVCEGVQHAHHKAVLHRDLKPSNILVADVEGKPLPKIIDFGVAKATGQRLTDQTMHTALGQLIGTPEYMSPEQAELTGEDVDTRSDVYSLGVVLFELMVGALPFEPKELRGDGFEGLRKIIREQEPPRPSTKLSTLGERSMEVSENRNTDPRRLSSQLKEDLDWIAMRCLEKNRNRRYGSPQEIAQDIGRHLEHRPVIAGPPSVSYRVKKFVRRNRIIVGMASAAVLVLIAFAAMTAMQSKRFEAERDRANQEAETAAAVSTFLVDLFEVSEPGRGRGESITARELLSEGTQKIDALEDQPKVASSLLHTMGRVHTKLGLYEEAKVLLERAVAARRALPDEQLQLASSLDELGWVCIHLGEYEVARESIDEAIALRKLMLPVDSAELGNSMNNRGVLLARTRNLEEARLVHAQALAIRESALGPDHPDVATSLNNLAAVMTELGERDEARALYERSLRIRERQWGPEHPDLSQTLNNMGMLALTSGDYAAAQPLFERTRKLCEASMGPDHPHVAFALLNLAYALTRTRDFDEAAELYGPALQIVEDKFGPDHPVMAQALTHKGHLLRFTGDMEGAREHYQRGLAIAEAKFGAVHPATAELIYGQASAALFDGQREEALDLLEDAVERGHTLSSLSNDVEMEALRGDPRLDALLAQLDR